MLPCVGVLCDSQLTSAQKSAATHGLEGGGTGGILKIPLSAVLTPASLVGFSVRRRKNGERKKGESEAPVAVARAPKRPRTNRKKSKVKFKPETK